MLEMVTLKNFLKEMWIMWIKKWIVFMGNLENVEYVRFLAHFCKNAVLLCQLAYTQKSTCFGEKACG